MAQRPVLRALADRLNILSEYLDYTGTTVRRASDEVLERIAAVLGYDASDERAAADSIRRLDKEQRSTLIEPAVVLRQNNVGRTVDVRTPPGLRTSVDWLLQLTTEDGTRHLSEGSLRAAGPGPTALPLPTAIEIGYHVLRLTLRTSDGQWSADQRLIVTPDHCPAVETVLNGRRSFGLCANLYTVRSHRNWGIGDTEDLRSLCRWMGRSGGSFVGINPLHTLRNTGWEISPYGPVSRLFKNAIYLDVSAVPEFANCPDAQRAVDTLETNGELAALRNAAYIDYERIWNLKLQILRMLHGVFMTSNSSAAAQRHRDYTAYVTSNRPSLPRFAVFMALDSHLAEQGHPRDWRQWPQVYRHPDSPAVQAFAQTYAKQVDFWQYLQFELDRQLGEVAGHAKRLEMDIGLYQDLALGSLASGSDAWSNQDLFVEGVGVGSPPDDYSATGQNWGFPPLNPHRLARTRFDYWTQLVRGALSHAGALRIDHVMGLYRQFWIPDGLSEGAYVAYPSDALFGILALESHRHNALVIGEDLGTIPPGFAEVLARWNILSCQVFYFERERDGSFRRSDQYADRSLVTMTTHDHPPLASFWEGRDLALRRDVGQIPDDASLADAQSERERTRAKVIELLNQEGLLTDGACDVSHVSFEALCVALHEFLCRTPAPLVGMMLDDLARETEPVNIPGVGFDRYPVWSRRARRAVEDVQNEAMVWRVLETARKSQGARPD